MSNRVQVPFEGNAQDKAVLLLAAVEELGLDASVVGTRSGYFLVPEEVAEKAFSEKKSEDEEKKPAKKAAAKKSTPSETQE